MQMPLVTAVQPVFRLYKLFALTPMDHDVTIIGLAGLTVIGSAGPLGAARAMTDAPGTNRVVVAESGDSALMVMDASSDRLVARIPLGGSAGSLVYDAGSGCVLASLPDHDEVMAIDPVTATIAGAFLLQDGDRPDGLALDEADRLLFVANRGRATLAVVSLKSMEVMDVAPTGSPDRAMAFDPGWHRLYAVTDDERLAGYDLRRSRLLLAGVLDHTAANGIAVDPLTHAVYVTVMDTEQRSHLRILDAVAPATPHCVFHHSTPGSPCLARYAPTR
jgi:DNA-binding beta-propeller fold protein YncE